MRKALCNRTAVVWVSEHRMPLTLETYIREFSFSTYCFNQFKTVHNFLSIAEESKDSAGVCASCPSDIRIPDACRTVSSRKPCDAAVQKLRDAITRNVSHSISEGIFDDVLQTAPRSEGNMSNANVLNVVAGWLRITTSTRFGTCLRRSQ
jgi:hypothetical protein